MTKFVSDDRNDLDDSERREDARELQEKNHFMMYLWRYLGALIVIVLIIILVLWNRGGSSVQQPPATGNVATNAASVANVRAPAPGSTNGTFEFAENTKTRGEYASTGVDLPTDSFIKQSKELMDALVEAQATNTALQKELAQAKEKAASLGATETLLKAEVKRLSGDAAALKRQLSDEEKANARHVQVLQKRISDAEAAQKASEAARASEKCEKCPEPVIVIQNVIPVPVPTAPGTPTPSPALRPKTDCVPIPAVR